MARSRKLTWMEVAVRNGGFRDGIKALDWAHSWIHVQVALGRDPSVDEVAEWWNISRRSAFRAQAAFRTCFPEAESPAIIYANNPSALDSVRRTVKALEKLDAAKRSRQAARDTDILNTGLLNPGS